MGKVTAGDGTAGYSPWRARYRKDTDDPSPPVTHDQMDPIKPDGGISCSTL